jgi:predicted nucleotidyltransferase
MSPDPVGIDTLYSVERVLCAQAVQHAFIGGLALSAWGVPRATFDLDLAIALPADQQGTLLAALRDLGWHVEEIFERGWRDQMAGMPVLSVRIPAERTLIRVDLLVAETPFLRSVLARRVEIDLGEGPVPVCSAADLVLLKLVAWRAKDRVDLDNVLWVQGVPERSYLERWAKELGVAERLEEILSGR